MKNVHVLPTDKPSRLYLNTQEYIFEEECSLSTDECQNKHIYITSDEEIKEGDWVITPTNDIIQWAKVFQPDGKKIILTTDQDLIKDGVQAIDDEFLEWFVKNPSCEIIDIETMMECEKCGKEHCDNLQCRGYKDIPYYKIIIPKKEHKQRLEKYSERFDNDKSPIGNPNTWGKRIVEEPKKKYKIVIVGDGLPKQETIEEELLQQIKFCLICKNDSQAIRLIEKYGFQKQEQMYSEEDLKRAFFSGCQSERQIKPRIDCWKEWFEQFKNK